VKYTDYISILHSLFERTFVAAYRDSNKTKRRKILPYLHAIHRRWYYSTLVEHTPFSPANLSECIADYFKENQDQYIVPILRSQAKFSGVDFTVVSYSAEKHPVVKDIRDLIDYCTPHIDLHESGCLTDEQAVEAAALLSINDPHYASFLLELAVWMKLFKNMPSLYVQRMQPSKKSVEILAQPDEELLREIVDAAIKMASFGLQNSVPLPEHIFSEGFVRSLLSSPIETDEIFERVFEVMGYDLDDLLEIGNMPLPEGMTPEHLGIDMELLSGTFIMGIVMDRYFFTPFGHFLRLIRPLYALPFAFSEEVQDYIHVCDDPEEAFIAFFAPCSSYTLTDLGLKILNIKPTPENYFNAAELQFENMKDAIFASEDALAKFVDMATFLSPLALSGGLPGKVYTFRVRLESDSSIWLHMQVPDTFSLEHLYDEIAEYFNLKHNGEFSFFHDKTENRFAEYPSAKRVAKTKTPKPPAEECMLSELDFEHMKHMILAAYGQASLFSQEDPVIRFNLERMNEKDPDYGEMYPNVSRVSKKMQNYLGDEI